jgi:hypothetical protein
MEMEELSKDDQIEFKWLEPKLQGNDTVVFRLEDGALVKVKVDIDRAGLATNFRNPDGTPHYNVNANLRLTVIPPDKKFTVPRSSLQVSQAPKKTPPGQVT